MPGPRLVGDGPPTCSTSLEVAVQPAWIWDTNRYYADLGVDVRATRAEIRSAYQECGQRSVRLTFVVKQLLDPVVRRRYDMTPLGSVFFDRDIADRVRRVKALRMSVGAARVSSPVEATSTEVLDTEPVSEQALPTTTGWPFAYYLWGTEQEDVPRLREWQELLTLALGRQKEHCQIAVGLRGDMASPFEVTVLGYRVVAFLGNDEGPTDALATGAASKVAEILQSERHEHHGTS